MSANWPRVPLGEVLTRSTERITLDPQATYREVTVRLWGKGVTTRREVLGAEIASTERHRCTPNQFIVSRIDARNGAFGLIPPDLAGAVVTNDFPLFDLNTERLEPRFLGWLSRTADFVDLCKAASEGTTNRVRLKEDTFLATAIALPPLAEQRRIVSRVDAIAARIADARRLREEVDAETKSLPKAVLGATISATPSEDWLPLSHFVERIENGWSPLCQTRPATHGEWGVLKVGAVSLGYFDPTENKALPVGVEPIRKYEVRVGDFIMSRANTTALTGACALVTHTPACLLLSDKHFRFIFREGAEVERRYLDLMLKSPPLRQQIERGASGTSSSMKNISKDKVLALRLPPHPLAEQRRIVAHLDALQAKADTLRALQAEASAELDALLPAVLAKAFAGEL